MKTTPTFLFAALLAVSAASAYAADFSPLKPVESIAAIANKAQAFGDAMSFNLTSPAEASAHRSAAPAQPEAQASGTFALLLAGAGMIAAMSRRRLR